MLCAKRFPIDQAFPDDQKEEGPGCATLESLTIGVAEAPVLAGNHFNLTAENCPNARITGVAFENNYYFTSRTPSVDESRENGFTHTYTRQNSRCVFASLASYYVRKYSWLSAGGHCFGIEDLYVGLKMQPLDKSGNIKMDDARKKQILFDKLPRSHVIPKTVLVRGCTGFGKTTLCYKIAYDWSSQGKTFSCFAIDKSVVLFLEMRDLCEEAVLEDELLKLAMQKEELKDEDPTVQGTKDIIESYGQNVILVLDDYVGVRPHHQRQIRELLLFRPTSLFKEASIIVTSRPNIDDETLFLFHKNFVLNGFSLTLTQKIVGKYFKISKEVPASRYQDIVVRFQLKKVSPLLIVSLCQCELPLDNSLNPDSILRDLVFSMVKLSNEHNCQCLNDAQIKEKLDRLGSFFWKCYAKDRRKFSQEELKVNLKEDCDFALNSGLLKTKGQKSRDGSLNWKPVHMILMEIVSTFHLEKTWSLCARSNSVRKFLSAMFPKLPSVFVTCYMDQERNVNFLVTFDYRQFQLLFEITGNGEKFSVRINTSCYYDTIRERCIIISYRIPLERKEQAEEVIRNLENLFCNKAVLCLSQFISPFRFSQVELRFAMDCELVRNPAFASITEGATNELKSPPLSSLRNISNDFYIIFVKQACTSFIVGSVLNCVLGVKRDDPNLRSAFGVINYLAKLTMTPAFESAHIYGSKNTDRVSPSSSKTTKETDLVIFCERLELFFLREAHFDLMLKNHVFLC